MNRAPFSSGIRCLARFLVQHFSWNTLYPNLWSDPCSLIKMVCKRHYVSYPMKRSLSSVERSLYYVQFNNFHEIPCTIFFFGAIYPSWSRAHTKFSSVLFMIHHVPWSLIYLLKQSVSCIQFHTFDETPYIIFGASNNQQLFLKQIRCYIQLHGFNETSYIMISVAIHISLQVKRFHGFYETPCITIFEVISFLLKQRLHNVFFTLCIMIF